MGFPYSFPIKLEYETNSKKGTGNSGNNKLGKGISKATHGGGISSNKLGGK